MSETKNINEIKLLLKNLHSIKNETHYEHYEMKRSEMKCCECVEVFNAMRHY